jgi:Tfp pilus assembly protein PilO
MLRSAQKNVADQAVQKADISIKRAQLLAAVIASVLTAGLAIFTVYWNSQSKQDLLNQNYVNLEKRIDEKLATSKQIEELKKQVEHLQSQVASMDYNPGRR